MAAKRASRSIWKQIGRGIAIVAVLGFAYVAYIYLTLPDVRELAKTNPTSTAFMRLREEEARDEGRKFAIRHQWIGYGRVSPYLRRAVIVTEDAAFFDHDGIDMAEIKASLEKNWEEGQFLRGGSTLTQQLAKNLYLSPSRNPMRKVTELMIARRLESALSKQRIFEIYLNVIEWGDGIFGCEAAARAYFRKSCSALGMEEAALMAGSIINPRVHSPAKPTRRLVRRQQIILRRMGFKEPARPEPAPANQTPANQTPANATPIDDPLIPVPSPFPNPPAPSNKSGNGSPQIPPAPPKSPAGFGATGAVN